MNDNLSIFTLLPHGSTDRVLVIALSDVKDAMDFLMSFISNPIVNVGSNVMTDAPKSASSILA